MFSESLRRLNALIAAANSLFSTGLLDVLSGINGSEKILAVDICKSVGFTGSVVTGVIILTERGPFRTGFAGIAAAGTDGCVDRGVPCPSAVNGAAEVPTNNSANSSATVFI
jgi:hypothetical protein